MSSRIRYLLDTNVVSETRKLQANPRVISFLQSAEPATLFLSVLTIGELRKGVALKHRVDPVGAKKIRSWVDGLETTFADRIVGIDTATATLWGDLSAQRTMPVIDTLIAATALVHGMTVVTRNTADLAGVKVKLLNPWKD